MAAPFPGSAIYNLFCGKKLRVLLPGLIVQTGRHQND
jgi:hypothetical protein